MAARLANGSTRVGLAQQLAVVPLHLIIDHQAMAFQELDSAFIIKDTLSRAELDAKSIRLAVLFAELGKHRTYRIEVAALAAMRPAGFAVTCRP